MEEPLHNDLSNEEEYDSFFYSCILPTYKSISAPAATTKNLISERGQNLENPWKINQPEDQ
jgi:hypothetical protein